MDKPPSTSATVPPEKSRSKSPSSLEEGEVIEEPDAEPPAPPPAPAPPPRPRSPWSKRAYGPPTPASAVEPRRPTGPSQPLPPQEREWEREREAQMRERARERDKERERERDVFREREREREQRERDRERERERERERDRDRERELRERELQAQRDREREARERDAQLQRERDAQLQRERDAQLQREARERAQQQERDRELQLQLERERAELMQVDQSPPQPPAQPPARPTEERQLDVTDALSYLDMVKAQFQDMPEIYNQFLDTMKQFKSEQINTPGVIDRVSSLFAGHPRLIEGFNAFLPAGYRIECTTSYITVTTPSGTTKTQPPLPLHTFDQPPPPRLNPSRMGASTPVQAIPVVPASAVTGSSAAAGLPGGPGTPRSMHQEREAMRQQTDRERDREQRERDRREREQRQRQRDWDTQHQLQLQQQLVMPAPIPPTSDPQPPFNAAMEYVNRIKMRFADEPDIYKNFLDILQTYQKGGQGDSVAISHQITVLFRGNQDLIEEFKKFVNTNDDMMGGGGVDMDVERDRPERGDRRRRTTVINTEPPKRKRRVTDRTDVMPATRPPKKPRTDKSEQNQQQWAREPSPPPISHVRGQGHGQNQHHHHHHHAAQVAPLPPPAPPVPDESSFFERLGDPEFTRLARDFAHGDRNVDLRTLVEYLGDTPLGLEFREIVGWGNFMLTDNSNGPTQNGVTMGAGNGSGRLAARVDADEDLGPSYRRLPAADVSRHMSGRDDMCRDVLNDELVSHPSWAPGYASSSPAPPAAEKNAYEKALHRSEDERHEFDYAIDALVRTAVALDAAHQRVQGLPPDERNGHKFKLPLLGGLLKPVHVRTIRRVYGGGGAANDVLQALHDSPNTAIPVVTRRLRHKEDEWKRVQRTWNRVWRAVEAHNFFGSWDHEGAMARARDQEKLSSRALVDELDKARLTRLERRAAILDPGVRAAAEPRVDWSASFECVDVLQDALKLVFAFLGQLPSTSGIEKRRVEGFLRYLVPLVFAGHQDAWDEALGTVDEREEEERLKKKAAKSKKAANGTTNGNTLMLAAADGEPLPAPAAMDIISPLIQPMEIDKRDEIIESPASSTRVLFADRKIYVLLRYLEILYARLAHFSDLAHTLSTVESGSYLDHPLATQLGLTRSLPALAEAYGGSPERFYDVLLESVENVFCGDLAEPAFHANMRMMFGFEAAKLLTLDRLVGAVVKQAQVVLADKRCRHLVALAHQGNEREREAYRRVAEAEAGEDGLVYVRLEGSEMSAVLLMPGDRLPEDTERVDERWQAYMDAYARKKRTEGVKAPSKLPFLNRNLPRNKDAWTRDKSRLSSRRRLEAKVDRYSYRLMFVPGTEEVLARRWSASQLAAACGRAEKLAEERESCVTRFVNKDGA